MGTDIHLYVEVRRNGSWELSDRPRYQERNYDLFGMLADVRHGTGVLDADGFVPIAGPRGLPSDMSQRLSAIAKDEDEHEWLGDHCFSWLTLAELLAYDWNRPAPAAARCATYAQAAGEFYSSMIPEIKELGAPEDVRIVFGFDS